MGDEPKPKPPSPRPTPDGGIYHYRLDPVERVMMWCVVGIMVTANLLLVSVLVRMLVEWAGVCRG